MTAMISTDTVWQEIEKNLFGVIGMVTARGQARTVGIVYIVRDRVLYIGSEKTAWKTRHIAANPHVSMTIPIPKRVPLLPWIKIPAATITFAGLAKVLDPAEAEQAILTALFRGLAEDAELVANTALIRVKPVGDFITYGVAMPLLQMRDPARARGRAPVS